jgi:hypothetical protein
MGGDDTEEDMVWWMYGGLFVDWLVGWLVVWWLFKTIIFCLELVILEEQRIYRSPTTERSNSVRCICESFYNVL